MNKLATYVPTAFLFHLGCGPSWRGLGRASPGNADEAARTYSRKTEVDVTKPRKEAQPPKRNGGVPTISAPYLRTISLRVLSEVAKGGLPGNRGAPQQLSLPVYGNYCGLGHGDPTGNTPPIDAVDAVCREHDLCYALLGDFDSRCDQDFIECMPRAIASTPSPAGKMRGSCHCCISRWPNGTSHLAKPCSKGLTWNAEKASLLGDSNSPVHLVIWIVHPSTRKDLLRTSV